MGRDGLMILACLLGAYVVLCLAAFLLQKRLIYFPDRTLAASPGLVGLKWKDMTFEAEDGIRLHGWLVPAQSRERVILFCHGNAGNISHRIDSLKLFHDLGLTVFIFDYRGYGRSDGIPSERGTYRDAAAAWKLLTEVEGYRGDQIVLFGRSLGAAVAMDLASRRDPAALMVEGAFPSITDVGARAYWWLPVRLLARIRYDSRNKISRISCPKLFIHSTADDVVPFDLGRRLFELSPGPKTFLDVPGTHNEISAHGGSKYVEGFLRFLGQLGETSPQSTPVGQRPSRDGGHLN